MGSPLHDPHPLEKVEVRPAREGRRCLPGLATPSKFLIDTGTVSLVNV